MSMYIIDKEAGTLLTSNIAEASHEGASNTRMRISEGIADALLTEVPLRDVTARLHFSPSHVLVWGILMTDGVYFPGDCGSSQSRVVQFIILIPCVSARVGNFREANEDLRLGLNLHPLGEGYLMSLAL